MLVAIDLDDTVVAYNCQRVVWSFRDKLTHKFKCKDLNELSKVLNMEIIKIVVGGLFLLQEPYVRDLFEQL